MATKTAEKYFEAVGKRKNAIARVRLVEASKPSLVVNEKPADEYFATEEMQSIVREPLTKMSELGNFAVSVKVRGGGIHGQAEAVRHGIARALVVVNPENKKPLKDEGLITRDSRVKERRKFGLKKARKAAQWSKR